MNLLLYVSSLAPDASIPDVAKIAQVSRYRNAAAGITGLLVFDGSGFAQLLEGDRTALDSVLDRIKRDPRHHRVEVLAFEPTLTRRFPKWELGYHFAADERDDLDCLRGLGSQEALASFVSLLPHVDAEGGVAMGTAIPI